MGKMIFEFPDLTADSISALHIYSRPAPRKPRTAQRHHVRSILRYSIHLTRWTTTIAMRSLGWAKRSVMWKLSNPICKALCFCRWKVKAGMPQKTSIEIGRMIMEEEWQGKNRAAYAQQLL